MVSRIFAFTFLILANAAPADEEPAWQKTGTVLLGPSLRSDVSFSDHQHTHFSKKEGLASDNVQALFQSRPGFVWIGTNQGLCRFDGFRFRSFTKANSNLPSNDVNQIFEDSTGRLWVATAGGIAFLEQATGQFQSIPDFDGRLVTSLCESRRGNIWIAVEREIHRLEQSRQQITVSKITSAPCSIHTILEDRFGNFWFGAEFGLFSIPENQEFGWFEHEDFPYPNPDDGSETFANVRSLVEDLNGDLYVGSRRGLHRFKDGKLDRVANGLNQQPIFDILPTRRRDLLVAGSKGVFRSAKGASFEQVLNLKSCHKLLEGSEGGLFVGRIREEGLDYYQHGIGETLLASQSIHSIFEDNRKRVWVGTRDSGLYRFDPDGRRTQFGIEEGLPDARVYSIARGANRATFWVATDKCIVKWNGSQFTTEGVPAELSNRPVSNCLEDDRGVLYFTEESGGTFCVVDSDLTEVMGLGGAVTNWFLQKAPGVIWLGTNQGIFTVKEAVARPLLEDWTKKFPGTNWLSCHAAADGSFWLINTGGLVRIKSEESLVITTQEGLIEERPDRIVQDSQGNLWLGGPNGLYLLKAEQIAQFNTGELSKVRTIKKGTSSFSKTRFGPQALLASDGTIWIAADSGLQRIPAKPFMNQVAPVPFIDQIILNGQPVDTTENLSVEAGQRHLTINFGAISFLNADQARLRYQLVGVDGDWIPANEERIASYPYLPPGKYEFRLSAENADGVQARSMKSISVQVLPRWFETSLFFWSAIAGAIVISLASIYMIANRVFQKNRKRE